ncbi:hypothetical protein I7I53_07101 [Histoplasma capsulatum var. duboisii H88]|uniref:Uncharacterized protein n=1 Tax=Ajellomyces capsulatus (strain H88) TaxID=544711 RepID=A0A8A1LFN5_AJEC8|nr:hypothetical protein I7I53_07101 [Histoplasma capsulatum var. duboisii H88]
MLFLCTNNILSPPAHSYNAHWPSLHIPCPRQFVSVIVTFVFPLEEQTNEIKVLNKFISKKRKESRYTSKRKRKSGISSIIAVW